MAKYNGTVILSGMISTTDTTDKYPTHEDILGKGGLQTVTTKIDRDNIPLLRRKIGMLVYVIEENNYYHLIEGVTNNDWLLFTITNEKQTVSSNLLKTELNTPNLFNHLFSNIDLKDGELAVVFGSLINGLYKIPIIINQANLDIYDKYDFLIVYDTVEYTIYRNKILSDDIIENKLHNYDLMFVNITNEYNTDSKLKKIMETEYSKNYIVYCLDGIDSEIVETENLFDLLVSRFECLITFDGIDYSIYYQPTKCSIDELKSRLIIME